MVIKSSRKNDSEKSTKSIETENFYELLGLDSKCNQQEIRKAYYKLALKYHPDRIPISCDENTKKTTEIKFKMISFAYEVLGNPGKREIYDRNPLAFSDGNSEISRFTELFTKITTQDIGDFKNYYIGSAEELEDIMSSYMKNFGDIVKITEDIFFGSVHEEDRYLEIIKRQIARDIVPDYISNGKSPDSQRKKAQRLKKAAKEAQEASEYAKKLGIFASNEGSNLSALIQNRQKSKFDDMINNLESKYGKTPGSPSLKRNRSESDFDIQPISVSSSSKRIKSNFPAKNKK